MTLQQLEYIISTADEGSFSGAAEKLGIEQTELYDAIAGLELELDIGIFIPTQRGLALTPEGKELLGQARQVVSQVARIEDKFLNHNGERRLCAVSSQHYEFAAEAMGRMAVSVGGNFEFALTEGSVDQIIDDVRDMKSEVGLLHISDFTEKAVTKKFREARLVFHPLFDTSPRVLVRAEDVPGDKDTVSPDELKGKPLICFADSREIILNMVPELDQPYSDSRQMIVTDRSSLVKLLKETGGCSLTAEAFDAPGIKALRLETDEQLMVGWIEDTRGRLSDVARSYVRTLKQVISSKGFALYEDD